MDRRVAGRPLVPGTADGPVMSSDEPLSFWGGYDPATGEIIDRRHPLSGQSAAGSLLAIPYTRGSSTTTAILLESVRSGTAPAALICTADDPFLALAAVVAGELYEAVLPVVVVGPADMEAIRRATAGILDADGTIHLR